MITQAFSEWLYAHFVAIHCIAFIGLFVMYQLFRRQHSSLPLVLGVLLAAIGALAAVMMAVICAEWANYSCCAASIFLIFYWLWPLRRAIIGFDDWFGWDRRDT